MAPMEALMVMAREQQRSSQQTPPSINLICSRKGSYEPNSRCVEEGRTRKSCLAGGRGGAATDPRYTHPSRNAGGDVRGCGHAGIFNSIYVRHAAGALRSDPLAAGRKDDAVF